MNDDCERPKIRGKHKCAYHYLLRQPIEVQIDAAKIRRSRWFGEERARVPEREWPEGERWCAGCQSFVPFWYCGQKASRCKACASLSAHSARVEKVYGISPEDYEALMVLQGRVCYICRRKALSKRLAVDHDHTTGRVRGLLCADQERGCNRAILGNIRDLDMARRIVAYLEHPPYDQLEARDGEQGRAEGATNADRADVDEAASARDGEVVLHHEHPRPRAADPEGEGSDGADLDGDAGRPSWTDDAEWQF